MVKEMPDCELLGTCPFFNDKAGNTFEMADIHKEQYCKGNYSWCGRYLVFKVLERELERLGHLVLGPKTTKKKKASITR